MTLNTQQQQLVTDNNKLIYYCINKFDLNLEDTEDWYGIAAIGLCKAAYTYEENTKIKFDTYAVNVILNELRKILRKKAVSTIPVEAVFFDIENNNLLNDFRDSVELREVYRSLLKEFSNIKRQIIEDRFDNDLSYDEVGKKNGVSASYVGKVCTEFTNKLREELTNV